MAKRKLSYSDCIQQLESLTERLRKEEIALEELPNEIRKAKELIVYCKSMLRSIETEISQSASTEEE